MTPRYWYRITELDPPDSIVSPSQWGTLDYRAWCEREAARIRATGREARVMTNAFGLRIAVFVEIGRPDPEDSDRFTPRPLDGPEPDRPGPPADLDPGADRGDVAARLRPRPGTGFPPCQDKARPEIGPCARF